MPETPKINEGEVEDCEELDDDYFKTIGLSVFSIVDAWTENDEEDSKQTNDNASNHSKSSDRTSNGKKDMEPSTSRDIKDPRSRDTRYDKFSRNRSPERSRNRSPERNRHRESDDRRFRRQSPPPFNRKRPASPPPPRNRNQSQNSFLLELKEKFAKQGVVDKDIEKCLNKGMKIDWKAVNEKPETQNNFPMQMHPTQVMPHFNPMMLNQMNPNMMPMVMGYPPFPIVAQPQLNMYGNPLDQQLMGTSPPQPVPPPNINFSAPMEPEVYQSNMTQTVQPSSSNSRDQPASTTRENVEKQPQNKNESPGNLIDMLRQKSKKNKLTTNDWLGTKKEQVLERCTEAINLISDLDNNKSNVTLTTIVPQTDINYSSNSFHNRSPIIVNEKNPMYMFQATKEQCHSVLENHPLRNIYGPMANVAQHLKMDLHHLSNIVATEATRKESIDAPIVLSPPVNIVKTVTPSLSRIPPAPPKIKNNLVVNKKATSISIQTEKFECINCNAQQKKITKNIATNTAGLVEFVDAEVQYDTLDEEGGFRVYIDPTTMQDRNFEQHHALEVFCKAFNIECPYISKNNERGAERRRIVEVVEDRMNFANPENPNRAAHENSPVREDDSNFFSISPIRSTNLSLSPQVSRPHIFDRIGDKVSDHSDSPREYVDLQPNLLERPTFRPYTIPSPEYSNDRYYTRSPEPSRQYRNRSRSNSRSRSRSERNKSDSRSPKRYKTDFRFNNRRGRY